MIKFIFKKDEFVFDDKPKQFTPRMFKSLTFLLALSFSFTGNHWFAYNFMSY